MSGIKLLQTTVVAVVVVVAVLVLLVVEVVVVLYHVCAILAKQCWWLHSMSLCDIKLFDISINFCAFVLSFRS